MNSPAQLFWGAAVAAGLVATAASAQTSLDLGRQPLRFEATAGEAAAVAPFVARGRDAEFLISRTGAQFVLRHPAGKIAAAKMQFVGANPAAAITGGAELAGKINYLLGTQSAQWRVGMPTFAQVQVDNIYPGINVVYYGNGRQLEYDFHLAAGVEPQTIALRFDGAEKIAVNPQGELVVSLPDGEMVQRTPVVYQNDGSTRREISGGYRLLDAHTATFALGAYDHRQPVVIDPVLSYSTYFGGNNTYIAHAIALDTNGCIYIAGETLSTQLTSNSSDAFQTNFHGGTITGDAFVAKFDNTGQTNLYCTYLGGSSDDTVYGLAVDKSGNVYLTGATRSADFPTNNALYGYKAGPLPGYYGRAFVAELNTNGSKLLYSTFLSGNLADAGFAIAVDAAQNAYVAGYTCSTNFPVTARASQTNLLCTNSIYYNRNAFVAEISAGGTNLLYSSYLGGQNYDQATGITVDQANFIYVTGLTASTNFPTTNALAGFKFLNGATNASPACDAFVCKYSPGFTNLVYATFLGGTNSDAATAITADTTGHAYVVGWTVSTNFPGAYRNDGFTNCTRFVSNQLTNNLFNLFGITTNAFLTELSANGASILHTAVFGGSLMDVPNGVALDAAGNIYLVGSSVSTNYPVTPASLLGSLQATNSGAADVFVTAFKADWSGLLYSTYLGGWLNDFGNAIAVDAAGNAYIAGQTFSTNYPSFNGLQPALNLASYYNGTSDAFLTKILPAAPTPTLTINPVGTNVLVSWPPLGQESPALFGLQTATNLTGTNVWTLTTNAAVLTNSAYTYTLGATNHARFFRLLKY